MGGKRTAPTHSVVAAQAKEFAAGEVLAEGASFVLKGRRDGTALCLRVLGTTVAPLAVAIRSPRCPVDQRLWIRMAGTD